jgi:hypothetical protein
MLYEKRTCRSQFTAIIINMHGHRLAKHRSVHDLISGAAARLHNKHLKMAVES